MWVDAERVVDGPLIGFGLGCRAHMQRASVGGAFPISRSSAVCRQRWTVRLGEVEPVFGQTGRVVLDITARDCP